MCLVKFWSRSTKSDRKRWREAPSAEKLICVSICKPMKEKSKKRVFRKADVKRKFISFVASLRRYTTGSCT